MIRGRRGEDLEPLVALLPDLASPWEWLTSAPAETSWVFDQAPVHVTPTRNVVGHVQVYRPPDAPWATALAARLGRTADELGVVGRLFARPSRHADGVARYLLKEAAADVEARGLLPVIDPDDVRLVPPHVCTRLGFEDLGDETVTLLVRSEARPRRPDGRAPSR